jgi:uncharacterized protein (TIGR02996 family)
MADHAGLLAEIIAHPEDDVPRLVCADWLEEHGESEHAEFIRLQCALARLEAAEGLLWSEFCVRGRGWGVSTTCHYLRPQLSIPTDSPRCQALRERARTLLRRHGGAWEPRFHSATEYRFRRGFVERLSATATRLLAHADEWFEAGPVVELALTRASGRLSRLAEVHELSRLRVLRLWREHLTDADAEALAQLPQLASLRVLDLRYYNRIGAVGARALAASPYLGGLAALELSGNPIPPGEVELLRRRFGERVKV